MLIDISRPIHEKMAIYPGNLQVSLSQLQAAKGDQYGLTAIQLGSHTGTHIDTPLHINSHGKGAEQYLLDSFIGDCEVIEITSHTVITAQDLPATTSSRILIKTANSNTTIDEFDSQFIALDESSARELTRRHVKLIGIDALSIKKKGVKDSVHHILLNAGVIILEGLWLHNVASGQYELMCLPLSLAHTDGVPVRAVLAPLEEAH